MVVAFTSTYGRCHGHDCIIVVFLAIYGGCHGHDCIIVRFTSTNGGCHGRMYTEHTKPQFVSTQHYGVRTKTWLARNQNNVSEWSDMSIHGLLFQ
jgi:hypothetical protein